MSFRKSIDPADEEDRNMEEQIFRKSAVERITSPEQINDYIHVTTPKVWITLAMVILVIVGGLVWAGMTTIDSIMTGTAEVSSGVMTVTVAFMGYVELSKTRFFYIC